MKLRDYQSAIVDFIIEHPRCNVWAGMGVGKTVSVLTALDFYHNVWGEDRPTLVLAPKRVAASTWPAEVRKWPHLRGLDVAVAVGDPATRALALKRDAPIVAMNYDNIPWLMDHLKGKPWPFGRVVPDEATRLKSFRLGGTAKGIRARQLGAIAHKQVDYWTNLTGTPAPNGLVDAWGQQWFIDAGARLGRSYTSFEERWFAWKRRGGDQFAKDMILLEGAETQIHTLLRDCTITIEARDFLDLPPLIENVVEVELPAAARKHYRELEKELFTRLADGSEVEAFNAASLSMKCLQAANGALYTDDQGNWTEIHDAKLDALDSIVEEAAGMPVLVAYHFKSDLARLQRAFPQGRVLDDKPATIEQWNAGRVPLLFAHPASAGHGLNLQEGGNIIAFFGSWWNLEEHEQIIERIGPTRQAQSGLNRPTYVHRIVARDTVDEAVLLRLKSKASVQSALLQAMKAKTQ